MLTYPPVLALFPGPSVVRYVWKQCGYMPSLAPEEKHGDWSETWIYEHRLETRGTLATFHLHTPETNGKLVKTSCCCAVRNLNSWMFWILSRLCHSDKAEDMHPAHNFRFETLLKGLSMCWDFETSSQASARLCPKDLTPQSLNTHSHSQHPE